VAVQDGANALQALHAELSDDASIAEASGATAFHPVPLGEEVLKAVIDVSIDGVFIRRASRPYLRRRAPRSIPHAYPLMGLPTEYSRTRGRSRSLHKRHEGCPE
jgi:hypothetical protein